jgi:vancomycin resistance protein VanJ
MPSPPGAHRYARESVSGAEADWDLGTARRVLPRNVRFWIVLLSLLYGAGLGALTVVDAAGAERWWWATVNLYLPQWPWGVPAVVLLGLSLRYAPRLAWLPLTLVLWVMGPLAGLCWPADAVAVADPKSRLRVMTYNVKGQPDGALVLKEIAEANPDLLLLQETGSASPGTTLALLGLEVAYAQGHMLLATRLPVLGVEKHVIPGAEEWREYLRCRLELGGRAVTVYNLHLDTPREGLLQLRYERHRGIAGLEANTRMRLARAAGMAALLRQEQEPLLVAGDFNAPQQSLICRSLLDTGLRDAFSLAGWGYGYSYGQALRVGLGHSYVRIDHILVNRDWSVGRCWTGGPDGSDHRPVIADLALDVQPG